MFPLSPHMYLSIIATQYSAVDSWDYPSLAQAAALVMALVEKVWPSTATHRTLTRMWGVLIHKVSQLSASTVELTDSTFTLRGGDGGEAWDILIQLGITYNILQPTVGTMLDQLLGSIFEQVLKHAEQGSFVNTRTRGILNNQGNQIYFGMQQPLLT